MKNHELLSSLLRITQAGQVEIRSVMDTVMGSSLRKTLISQLREYDAMETEALTVALQRGWDLKELAPGSRFLLDRKTRWLISGRNTDSAIAEFMIKKNTKAIIDSLKSQHQFPRQDPQLSVLSQKLLDSETAHIQKLQRYL